MVLFTLKHLALLRKAAANEASRRVVDRIERRVFTMSAPGQSFTLFMESTDNGNNDARGADRRVTNPRGSRGSRRGRR